MVMSLPVILLYPLRSGFTNPMTFMQLINQSSFTQEAKAKYLIDMKFTDLSDSIKDLLLLFIIKKMFIIYIKIYL
jgi:hypothetical protein